MGSILEIFQRKDSPLFVLRKCDFVNAFPNFRIHAFALIQSVISAV